MKNLIKAFLMPFKKIKLERQLSEVIHHLTQPSFMTREDIKSLFKKIIDKTDIELYPIIANHIVPDTSLAYSRLNHLLSDDDLYHVVENLPHQYFENKSANDFIYRLQIGSNETARDVNFNVFLLLINHYEAHTKIELINRCNEMLFGSIFDENLSPNQTIKSPTVQKWAMHNKLPLNPDIFWKHATFFTPRHNEISVEKTLESVEKAFNLCSDTLLTHEKFINDYKRKVEQSNYRHDRIKQRDLKTINEHFIKNIIGQEYEILKKALDASPKQNLKMKNKI